MDVVLDRGSPDTQLTRYLFVRETFVKKFHDLEFAVCESRAAGAVSAFRANIPQPPGQRSRDAGLAVQLMAQCPFDGQHEIIERVVIQGDTGRSSLDALDYVMFGLGHVVDDHRRPTLYSANTTNGRLGRRAKVVHKDYVDISGQRIQMLDGADGRHYFNASPTTQHLLKTLTKQSTVGYDLNGGHLRD